jgi:hypothetical protein
MVLGTHAAMVVGRRRLVQSTVNAGKGNPRYRTLFNMSVVVLTIEASGHVFRWLGGSASAELPTLAVPLMGMTATYFLVNTAAIALAVALSTNQSAWRIWKSDFASSAPNYVLGAGAAALMVAVTSTWGAWLALIPTAAPLYLTYRAHCTSVEVGARQGAISDRVRRDPDHRPADEHPRVQPGCRAYVRAPRLISFDATWSSSAARRSCRT